MRVSNTYEACIESPQTSCWRGLANPFPSSSREASKKRSFESPFVNMGFDEKEDEDDDTTPTTPLLSRLCDFD